MRRFKARRSNKERKKMRISSNGKRIKKRKSGVLNFASTIRKLRPQGVRMTREATIVVGQLLEHLLKEMAGSIKTLLRHSTKKRPSQGMAFSAIKLILGGDIAKFASQHSMAAVNKYMAS
eukprot:TRINITY_DN24580_c0_g1_i1.p2 TRINITY_DN24580_c0_g1~~TRINITY_DN24580_c0_g1_i1.p2  ORF type:complete len:120 (+),score=10.13 TRINITY_DN24580_c0_g1_i1:105-464(+)